MPSYTNNFEFPSYDFDESTHFVSNLSDHDYPTLSPPSLTGYYSATQSPATVLPTPPGVREVTPGPIDLESHHLSRGERKIRLECGLAELSNTPLGLEVLLESQVPSVKPPVLKLVMLAIWQAPSKRLTTKGIIDAICAQFPKLRAVSPWKKTVRHTLSKRVAFRKMRPKKGHKYLWTFVIEDETEVYGPLQKRALENGKTKRPSTSNKLASSSRPPLRSSPELVSRRPQLDGQFHSPSVPTNALNGHEYYDLGNFHSQYFPEFDNFNHQESDNPVYYPPF